MTTLLKKDQKNVIRCDICNNKTYSTDITVKANEQTTDGVKIIVVCLKCFKNECCWSCSYWTGQSYCNLCRKD